jgi:hypothetical protein
MEFVCNIKLHQICKQVPFVYIFFTNENQTSKQETQINNERRKHEIKTKRDRNIGIPE